MERSPKSMMLTWCWPASQRMCSPARSPWTSAVGRVGFTSAASSVRKARMTSTSCDARRGSTSVSISRTRSSWSFSGSCSDTPHSRATDFGVSWKAVRNVASCSAIRSPCRIGESAERGDVQLPTGEKPVASERAVGGLVDVVGNADIDPRLKVAKQPGFVRQRIPVRLGLGSPEDEHLVEDQDGMVPAVRQVPVRCPRDVGKLLPYPPQEQGFFHGASPAYGQGRAGVVRSVSTSMPLPPQLAFGRAPITALTSRNSSKPKSPHSRPLPDCL